VAVKFIATEGCAARLKPACLYGSTLIDPGKCTFMGWS
jgi:hypothetical protein